MKNNSNAVLLRRVNPWSLLLILAVSLLLPLADTVYGGRRLGAAAQNGSFPPPPRKKRRLVSFWMRTAGRSSDVISL